MQLNFEPEIKWEYLALTRFILALIVFFGHLNIVLKNVPLFSLISKFGGFEAVLGFLLISGFSIGHSLNQNKNSFIKRRVARIFPVYIISIVIYYLFNGFDFSIKTVLTGLGNLFFLNGIVFPNILRVNWSLSLEVWLYILAPFLYKMNSKQLLFICGTSLICYCFYSLGEEKYKWPYYSTTLYGINLLVLNFIWIAGFGLAKSAKDATVFKLTIFFLFSIHISMLLCVHLLSRIKHHDFSGFLSSDLPVISCRAMCLYGTAFIVCFNRKLWNVNLATKRFFSLLGNISYPLYLIHLPVIKYFKDMNINSPLLFVIIPLLLAYIVFLLFDFYPKIRKYKDLRSAKQPIF